MTEPREPTIRVGQSVLLIAGHFTDWRRLTRAERQVHVVGVVQHITEEDPTWWVYPKCTRLDCSYADWDFEVVDAATAKPTILCHDCFND